MLQDLRDLAIILLAVETIVVFIVLGVAGWQIWRLIQHIKGYVDQYAAAGLEVLDIAKEAARTTADTAKKAQGTAAFVGDHTARPVIEAYSVVAGASRFARVLFGVRSKDTKKGDS